MDAIRTKQIKSSIKSTLLSFSHRFPLLQACLIAVFPLQLCCCAQGVKAAWKMQNNWNAPEQLLESRNWELLHAMQQCCRRSVFSDMSSTHLWSHRYLPYICVIILTLLLVPLLAVGGVFDSQISCLLALGLVMFRLYDQAPGWTEHRGPPSDGTPSHQQEWFLRGWSMMDTATLWQGRAAIMWTGQLLWWRRLQNRRWRGGCSLNKLALIDRADSQ